MFTCFVLLTNKEIKNKFYLEILTLFASYNII